MKHLKHLFLVLLLVLYIGKLSAQNKLDSLLTQLELLIQEENIPGVMLSLVKSDSIIFKGGLGLADIKSAEKVTGDHLFRLGSISKSIAAMGMVKLTIDNQLNLSQPIIDIDSDLDFLNKWQKISPITIEQVLEHTAGFDDLHRHTAYANDSRESSSLEKIKIHKNSLYARWEPGVRYAYSNPGYVLIGHLIESITAKSYNRYLKDEILNPLGMDSSGFFFSEPKNQKMSTGYMYEGHRFFPTGYKSVNGGAASDFCSNANEMALFLQYMLSRKLNSNSEIIPEQMFDRIEMSKTNIAAKNDFYTIYGLGNMGVWTNNHLFHGHDGGIDGFSSLYLYSREADFGFAISMNVNCDPWILADRILDSYVGKNSFLNTSSISIAQETKERYSGFYNLASPRNQKTYFLEKMNNGHSISFDENTLLIHDFKGVVRDTLYHRGDNIFFRKSEGVPFLMLLEDKKKQPIIWLGSEYGEKTNVYVRKMKNYLIVFSIVMIFQFFIIGFVGLLRKLINRKRNISHWIYLWWATLSLIISFVCFAVSTELYERPGTINLGSMIIFMGSCAFFIFSVIALFKTIKTKRGNGFLIWYYRLTAMSVFTLAFWMLMNGLIGFRLWQF